MKTGKTLTELAIELDRQKKTKRDFVAPSSRISAVVEREHGAPVPMLALRGNDAYGINGHAHGQLAVHTAIPKSYYDRMLTDAPELWADNVNTWLHRGDEARMVRTLDGRVRALLSDRFRPLENYDLAQAVLPALRALGKGLEITSCDVTETRLYIKAVDRDREANIERAFEAKGLKKGTGHNIIDVVSPAIAIVNSEVGAGTLAIMRSIFVKACTNLAVFEGGEMKKYHIGKKAEVSDEVYALLTDKTRETMDAAVWMQARDVTVNAFDPAHFEARVAKLQATTENEIKIDVVEVTERARLTFGLRESERDSMLEHLIRGGDFTQYGLHNAMTRTAEDLESYDRASELERLGARIIELPATQWHTLAVKKAA